MFIVANPSSDGGQVSFNMKLAATIADLGGRTLRGFFFRDDAAPTPLALTIGPPGTNYAHTVIQFGNNPNSQVNGTIQTFASVGSFPTDPFSALQIPATDPGNKMDYILTNALAGTFPNLAKVPGLFYIPGPDPTTTDGGVIVGGLKVNGKVILFGVVIDDRSNTSYGKLYLPKTVALPITGNFIAFEQ
jgi:hypothetical protein